MYLCCSIIRPSSLRQEDGTFDSYLYSGNLGFELSEKWV